MEVGGKSCHDLTAVGLDGERDRPRDMPIDAKYVEEEGRAVIEATTWTTELLHDRERMYPG
jgi:hypothetical protein